MHQMGSIKKFELLWKSDQIHSISPAWDCAFLHAYNQLHSLNNSKPDCIRSLKTARLSKILYAGMDAHFHKISP